MATGNSGVGNLASHCHPKVRQKPQHVRQEICQDYYSGGASFRIMSTFIYAYFGGCLLSVPGIHY